MEFLKCSFCFTLCNDLGFECLSSLGLYIFAYVFSYFLTHLDYILPFMGFVCKKTYLPSDTIQLQVNLFFFSYFSCDQFIQELIVRAATFSPVLSFL